MSPESGGPVILEREEGGLAVLTLDNPPLNLFDQAMIEGIQAAISTSPPSHRGRC